MGQHIDDRQISELQGLRGVAALIVAVHHMTQVYEIPWSARILLDVTMNSHAAVVLFFVLSGYVLTRSLLRSKMGPGALRSYYVRRLFRIYPAVWAASLIGLVVIVTLGASPIAPTPSAWFTLMIDPDGLTAAKIVLAPMALGGALVPPIWTIFTELVGSFVLPGLVLAARRGAIVTLSLIVGLVGLAVAVRGAPWGLANLAYLVDFALGMAVALASPSWTGAVARYSRLLGAMALLVLIFGRTLWFWVVTGQPQPLTYDFPAIAPSLIEAAAAAVLIACIVIDQPAARLLSGRPIQRLGEISYSLYLTHFPITCGVVWALSPLNGQLGVTEGAATWVLVVIAMPLTLAASVICYRFVERPGMALGRRVAEFAAP